jgi:phage N-6-adenine-methyltransferase
MTITANSLESITSSQSVEWFTPPEIIESVREFFGEIDLDPASCEKANEIVQARRIYTVADDGLNKPWEGRVFCNPPYGKKRPGVKAWVQKAIAESKNADTILLVNSSTGERWFRPLFDYPICFAYRRIRFIDETGLRQMQPVRSNVLVFVSAKTHWTNPHRRRPSIAFNAIFGKLGSVFIPDALDLS